MKKKITVIFKTHLDIGYTDLACEVEKRYFNEFITNAVKTADWFREHDHNGFRYRWTVGAWLVSEYLERADAKGRRLLEKAVADGDIVWHAMPFTTHSEFAGREVFAAGLRTHLDLNARFGKSVHAGKMTDVPGHTRGIIAPMVENGIDFLHIGINPASAVVQVPPLFRWRNRAGQEIIVAYQPTYGTLLQMPDGNAFLVSVAGDNTGCHKPETVLEILKDLHGKFPDAEIRSGTFDDMAECAARYRDTLPVVTSEIGDSWIHGMATDPVKTAQYRACVRFAETMRPGKTKERFLRKLELVAEHTWGVCIQIYLPEERTWNGKSMEKLSRRFPKCEASWREQRAYIPAALDVLPKGMREKLEKTLAGLAVPPNGNGAGERRTDELFFETRHYTFRIDAERGCLADVKRKDGTMLFAKAGLFAGDRYSPADYREYQDNYLRLKEGWPLHDFGHPGMPEKPHVTVEGVASRVTAAKTSDGLRIVLRSRKGNLFMKGWEEVWDFPDSAAEIRVAFRWRGKDPSRIAHSLWVGFEPTASLGAMSFTKLGEKIDPQDVCAGGGRALHAIDGAVLFGGEKILTSSDAPLLAPGERDICRFRNPLPTGGVAPFWFNLYNNVWGTNFPVWFGEDAVFRFTIR